jgi:hypothetical protein
MASLLLVNFRKENPEWIAPKGGSVPVSHENERIKGESITVRGLIIPSSWDELGAVTGVVLAAFDENEYQFENGVACESLKEYLHCEVMISGRLVSGGGDKPLFRIENYHVVDPGEIGWDI